MISLNNRQKTNKKKIRVGRGIVLEKEKHQEEVLRVKNQDQVFSIKVLVVNAFV